MSGSSLDGLDVAHVHFKLEREPFGIIDWELIEGTTFPFSESWQKRLADLPHASGKELTQTDRAFGHYMADILTAFPPLSTSRIDFIASHGHTVFHYPESKFTLQIGSGAAIAALTRLPVICDFRSTDVALGGQGAPIAPLADKYLFPEYHYFLNIGGIANVSIKSEDFLAFDVVPANQVLNYLSGLIGKKYDDKGEIARSGSLNTSLLEVLNQIDYLELSPPKSIDNQWIKEVILPIFDQYNCSTADKLRTICEWIALQIGIQLRRTKVSNKTGKMLVTGGGAYNTFLIERLKTHLPQNISLEIPSPEIIEFKEAVLMALMGVFRWEKQVNCLSSVTGSERGSVGGCVYWGNSASNA